MVWKKTSLWIYRTAQLQNRDLWDITERDSSSESLCQASVPRHLPGEVGVGGTGRLMVSFQPLTNRPRLWHSVVLSRNTSGALLLSSLNNKSGRIHRLSLLSSPPDVSGCRDSSHSASPGASSDKWLVFAPSSLWITEQRERGAAFHFGAGKR